MNAVKRAVIKAGELTGIKKILYLTLSALVFALPFMTKSLSSNLAIGSFTAVFSWCGLSALFITVFDFRKTLKRVLCSLFCFFFAFYFFVYSWFVNLYPMDFAGFDEIESVFVIAAAVILIPLVHSIIMTCFVFVAYIASRQVKNSIFRAVTVSCGYVIGEYAQSLGTFAFPWARLFVGQTAFPELLQSASLFGSYFVTFVIVLVNALLAFWLINSGKGKKKSALCLIVALSVFAFNLGFGIVRVHVTDFSDCRRISALVLQGNIPSGEKWSGEVDEKEVYLDLANWAKDVKMSDEKDVDIAVMPETAFPVTLYPDDGYLTRYEKTLIDISSVLDTELFAGAFSENEGKSFNSIFAISPDGSFTQPYNKYNIVPFGEFVPYRSFLERAFPVFSEMNMFSSDISRGESFEPINTGAGRAACLVCFDSIFPKTARLQIKNGGQFIVIATNDSWYKTSAAIYQHADHAIMRAIENNVPVIRSANTGISRIIDCRGRVVEQTLVNKETAIIGEVYLPERMTLYTCIGDVFIFVSAVMIMLAFALGKTKKPRA